MTATEWLQLRALRDELKGSNYFVFEREGQFILCVRTDSGRSPRVLTRTSITDFIMAVRKAVSTGGRKCATK